MTVPFYTQEEFDAALLREKMRVKAECNALFAWAAARYASEVAEPSRMIEDVLCEIASLHLRAWPDFPGEPGALAACYQRPQTR